MTRDDPEVGTKHAAELTLPLLPRGWPLSHVPIFFLRVRMVCKS